MPRTGIRSARGIANRRALLILYVQLLASYFVIPIDECAVGVVAPCPDVEFKEVWKLETIGSGDELKVLSIECRRCGVVLHPGSCVDNVLNADESARVADGLVDQGFGVLKVDLSVADERTIDIVNSHGTM